MKGQRRLLLTLRNGIKLLWNAAPWYLIGIVFLSSLSGLIVPLNTLVWKYFLDVISQVFMSYVWSNTILILLLFLSLITIINYILNTVFSSLDADAENRIVGNFRNVRKDNLNIIITHRFSSISLADEIIVLENGRVTEKGSHVELLNKKGTYSLLYKAQMLFV